MKIGDSVRPCIDQECNFQLLNVDISESDLLISVGCGIEEEDNSTFIHDLADALDATVSASRLIIDSA